MDTPPDLLTHITDELPVGLWVARVPGGELVYANRTFQEIMGVAARDDVAVGEYAAPYGICDRTGRPYPESGMPFVRAVQDREQITVDDIVIHRSDGERVYVRARARPLFAADGTLEMVSIAFLDITREVLAQAELERAQRREAVGTLAGGIAHDFNNLLTSIQVLSDALASTEPDPSRKRDLDTIVRATERAASLTQSLLGLARKGKHRTERVDLSAVVRGVHALLSRTIDARVRIELALAEGCCVQGDPTQLEHVVLNLILNGAEAQPEGGAVRVSTRRLGADVVLEVHDDGPGIPDNLRDKVFEPYFTTKSGTGGRRGTGLGLAMVLGIVELHQGAVELVPGDGGARVRVTLAASEGADLAAPVVLVVDDDDLVRQAARSALRLGKYDVLEAADGQQALDLLDDGASVDAILLDLTMPVLDGAATYRVLRVRYPQIPVVLTTGYAANEQAQELLDLGVAELLPKPYRVRRLLEIMKRLAAK